VVAESAELRSLGSDAVPKALGWEGPEMSMDRNMDAIKKPSQSTRKCPPVQVSGGPTEVARQPFGFGSCLRTQVDFAELVDGSFPTSVAEQIRKRGASAKSPEWILRSSDVK
jgi:hypothetical protein